MKKTLFFLFLFFIQTGLLNAAPSINSISNNWSHKSSVTITGNGFGTKTPAAPLKWDDGEDKTTNSYSALSSEYSNSNPGGYDGCPDRWKIQYRNAPYTSVSTPVPSPHRYSSKYIVGGHHEDNIGDHEARDVQITVATPSGFKDRWFATWYYTLDPAWPTCGNSPNHKIMCIQSGTQAYSNSPYPNQFFYMDFSQHPCNKLATVGMKTMGNFSAAWCGEWYQNPSACNSNTFQGAGSLWLGNSPSNANWVRLETQLSNDQGFLSFLIDNSKVWHGEGRPGWVTNDTAATAGIRSYSVGGYYRYGLNDSGAGYQHNNAFRYFDDVYVDCTLSRVILANNQSYSNATILEPQIPSAWTSNSIACSVNLGKLPDTGTVYLFVFDADNNRNVVGFPVTIGESGKPPAPTLSITTN